MAIGMKFSKDHLSLPGRNSILIYGYHFIFPNPKPFPT